MMQFCEKQRKWEMNTKSYCRNLFLFVVGATCLVFHGFGQPNAGKDGDFKETPVRILFDTDMVTDYDDVGALALLHAFADEGKCRILATCSCTRDNSSVAAVEIINAYYGRGDIPVGCSKEIGVVGVPEANDCERWGHQKYVKLAKKYSGWVRHENSNDATDSNIVYRRALAAEPDGSVVVCSVGFMTNMRRLLESKPDEISPLTGRELIAKKVRRYVAMAGKMPKGCEFNVQHDAQSAKITAASWPTEVVFVDYFTGRHVYCGRGVAEAEYAWQNPVKDIFVSCLPSREAVRAGNTWDKGEGGHSSWDELTVLVAVCGISPYFNYERGKFEIVDSNGTNVWTPATDGRHIRVTPAMSDDELGRIMDEIIKRPPRIKAAGK